jgi:hypothetical protein
MRIRQCAALVISTALPVLAHAHHPTGGATPATALGGTLSVAGLAFLVVSLSG